MTRAVISAISVAAAGCALMFAGCGDDNDSTATTGGSAAAGGTDIRAAKAAVAKYTGKPTAFPVDEPLKTRPTGKTFAYLQCSTPACALFSQVLQPTQKLLGYKLRIVKAGPSATELQSALNTIIGLKPDGVLLPASDPKQFPQQMQRLQAAKTPISANGITDPEQYGIKLDFINNETDLLIGRLMADWVVAQTGGGEVAFYSVPELSFMSIVRKGFDDEIAAICSSCKVRHVDIPIATIGKTAPSAIVSDLQSHPNTKAVAFGSAESATGLPAALKGARLDPKIIGFGPAPAVLGYIKAGQWDAAVGVDVATMLWAQVDGLARLVAGEPLTSRQKAGKPPMQILTQSDITFDPAKGFTAYPDFAARFAKLWGAKG